MASKKKAQNIFATNAAARAQEFEAHKAAAAKKADQRKVDNRFALIVSGGAVVLALLLQFAYFGFGPGHVTATPSASASASANSAAVPSAAISEGRTWVGSMKVGSATLGISLDGAKAPQAVANFVSLFDKGFYEGLSCHRLTTAGIYVLQCGDPSGDGTGGPGYNWGPIENAPADNLYKEGVLAMARRGGDGSSMGSQFFIVYKDSPIPADAAGGYTVFGKITKGLSSLGPVIKAGVKGGGTDGAPAKAVKLSKITIK